MRVVCLGPDRSAVEYVRLAIRRGWPDASFLLATEADAPLVLLESQSADLVVLVVRNLEISVPDFCARIRELSDVPLIVIGHTEGEDSLEAIAALEQGADDYISQSIELAEFEARILALLRRT